MKDEKENKREVAQLEKPVEVKKEAVHINSISEADKEQKDDLEDDEETLDLTKGDEEESGWASHRPLLLALAILIVMLTLEFGFKYQPPFPFNLVIFTIAFLLAGYNVLGMAFRKAKHFDFFNEFFLMSVATIGAFSIGSYSEGVAVMVFYSIGEWFQDAAVSKAKKSIKALLDIRPNEVTVIRDGKTSVIDPKDIKIDEIIQVKAGE
jgi:Cd2+/Zn2+-exporting ATPase